MFNLLTKTSRTLSRQSALSLRCNPIMTRAMSTSNFTKLEADSNQARAIGEFAIDFMANKEPDNSVYERVELFHTDSVVCGLSAIAMKANSPTVLRDEALRYPPPRGEVVAPVTVFGDSTPCSPERAIAANAAAVREWDSNGTVFGYREETGDIAGEFGHNDFYPVAIAGCAQMGLDGEQAAKAMILVDEIRGRLCEVFSLKTYKIDHVMHGAIASAATYGALLGASAAEIESAIGMVVAHYTPWRAIRAGKQLSDSKGASAALSTEVAIKAMERAMNGFIGPQDIFRNPEAIFRFFENTTPENRWGPGPCPFDLSLAHSGSDFAVMGMHFKLGLYEHQSAGALEGIITALYNNPELAQSVDAIDNITITAYEPAYGIIGDPAKMNPTTRQSADHSMAYITATTLRKAIDHGDSLLDGVNTTTDLWKKLILTPYDYNQSAIYNDSTRSIMQKINFAHGGEEFDRNYPDGIPTTVAITDDSGKTVDSSMIMYPAGHSRNTSHDLKDLLNNKFRTLGALATSDVDGLIDRLSGLRTKSVEEVATMYTQPIEFHDTPIDA